jgi:hypothetical protein
MKKYGGIFCNLHAACKSAAGVLNLIKITENFRVHRGIHGVVAGLGVMCETK